MEVEDLFEETRELFQALDSVRTDVLVGLVPIDRPHQRHLFPFFLCGKKPDGEQAGSAGVYQDECFILWHGVHPCSFSLGRRFLDPILS